MAAASASKSSNAPSVVENVQEDDQDVTAFSPITKLEVICTKISK